MRVRVSVRARVRVGGWGLVKRQGKTCRCFVRIRRLTWTPGVKLSGVKLSKLVLNAKLGLLQFFKGGVVLSGVLVKSG